VATRDIIVFGASAGGIEPLRDIIAALPATLPAAIFVVMHIPADSPSLLASILARTARLRVESCPDGAPVRAGRVCIAPPDRHLMIREERIRLGRGPRENNSRPAVDVLFRSAALCCGPRVIGVVLSGNLDDGTAGLLAIKERGGMAIVQSDPAFPGMPRSAAANVRCDHIVPAAEIAGLLTELAGSSAPRIELPPVSESLSIETQIAESALMSAADQHPGTPSSYACPECGGTLWELKEEGMPRFRCRVGHAYSPETLASEQSRAIEAALWVALRALEETESLSERMAERMAARSPSVGEMYRTRAREAREHAVAIRDILERGEIGAPLPEGAILGNGESEPEGGGKGNGHRRPHQGDGNGGAGSQTVGSPAAAPHRGKNDTV
jgi:two-component system, chemotaxis family, protein-glutamate methylesterase/glutaminase